MTNKNKKLRLVIVTALFCCMMTTLIGVNAFAKSPDCVEFTDYIGEFSGQAMPMLNFSESSSDEDARFVVTRQAAYVTSTGEVVEMNVGQYSKNAFIFTPNDDRQDIVELISPVVYVEKTLDEPINVEVWGSLADNSKTTEQVTEFGNISVSIISDSKNEEEAAKRGEVCVVIKYSMDNTALIPSYLELVNDGQSYGITAGHQVYDTETGEFLYGYAVFEGLSMEMLDNTAQVAISAIMEKYVSTNED